MQRCMPLAARIGQVSDQAVVFFSVQAATATTCLVRPNRLGDFRKVMAALRSASDNVLFPAVSASWIPNALHGNAPAL